MEYFIWYIALINIYSFLIMYIDKNKARKGKWRISEKNLFLLALIFGSIGVFSGMQIFRHKTKHKKFLIGIPLIIIVQLYLIFRFI
jgi:uncharacterized membrane protein YsdA (DUF1294 family)